MLNSTILPNYLDNAGSNSIIPYKDKILSFMPNAQIFILTDIDVNYGLIFSHDGSNRFDVILLGHEEYLTQNEYTNFKNFVSTGGKLIFLDGNPAYALINYSPRTNSIRLVSGHGWNFNGTHAYLGPQEYWATENTAWIGSNYYCFNCDNYHYDPFNYEHSNPYEDNYVTNPSDVIITNYHSTKDTSKIVATYQLSYGKGKTIMFGISSTRVRDDPLYLDYFRYILINRVLGDFAINPLG